MEAGTRVVGYARVSTTEQGNSGLGLDAQHAAIRAECDRREWVLVAIHHEVASAAKRKRRPILELALGELGRGDVLLVSKADRLARSLSAYVGLLEQARQGRWNIVAVDGSIDLTTPHGRAMAAMAQVFAALEAELIGERTKAALGAAKERGIQIGRRPEPRDPAVVARIKQEHEAGMNSTAIARGLNADGVPALGRQWYYASVERILRRV